MFCQPKYGANGELVLKDMRRLALEIAPGDGSRTLDAPPFVLPIRHVHAICLPCLHS
jgi:hypothetical protein